MRNKKYLRDKMNFLSAEGKSDYEVALEKAFKLLHNVSTTWTSSNVIVAY